MVTPISQKESATAPSPVSTDELARLFDALHGGHIIGAARPSPGCIRLVVENKTALGLVPDSWQRLVVTLRGCEHFAFITDRTRRVVDEAGAVMARRLRILSAGVDDGLVAITCDTPLERGVLRLDPIAFTIMLGCGRVVDVMPLLAEMGLGRSD